MDRRNIQKYNLRELNKLLYLEYQKSHLDKHEHILGSYYQQKVLENLGIFKHKYELKDLHNKEHQLDILQHIFEYNYLHKNLLDKLSHMYEFNFQHMYLHQLSKFIHII